MIWQQLILENFVFNCIIIIHFLSWPIFSNSSSNVDTVGFKYIAYLILQVMNRPVVTLRSVEKVSRVVSLLHSHTYNGFPVVDSIPEDGQASYFKSFGTLRGLILRSQLTVLLKHKVWCHDIIFIFSVWWYIWRLKWLVPSKECMML